MAEDTDESPNSPEYRLPSEADDLLTEKPRRSKVSKTHRPWGVLVVYCFLAFTSLGLTMGMGTIFIDLMDTFQTARAMAALVQSLCIGVTFGGGLIVGPLLRRYGAASVVVVGSLVGTAGCIISFFASNIAFIVVTIGCMVGIGSSCNFITSQVVPGILFHDIRSIVLSLISVCAAAGTAAFPLIYRRLVDVYGLRGTFLIIAGINLQMVLGGVIIGAFGPRQRRSQKPVDDEGNREIPVRKLSTGIFDYELVVEKCKSCEIKSYVQNENSIVGNDSNRKSTPEMCNSQKLGDSNTGSRTVNYNKIDINDDGETTGRDQAINSNKQSDVQNPEYYDFQLQAREEGNESTLENECIDDRTDVRQNDANEEKEAETKNRTSEQGFEEESPKAAPELLRIISEEAVPKEIPLKTGTDGSVVLQQEIMAQNGNVKIPLSNESLPVALEQQAIFTISNEDRRLVCNNRQIIITPSESDTRKRLDNTHTTPTLSGTMTKTSQKCCAFLQLDIFRDYRYLISMLFGGLAFLYMLVPSLFLTDIVVSKGHTLADGSTLLFVMFAGNVVGRIITGFLNHFFQSHILLVFGFALTGGGVVCFCIMFVATYPMFLAVCLAFGIGYGLFTASIPQTCLDIVGKERYAAGMGYAAFVHGMCILLAGPVGGILKDMVGSYNPMFYAALAHSALTGGIMVLISLSR